MPSQKHIWVVRLSGDDTYYFTSKKKAVTFVNSLADVKVGYRYSELLVIEYLNKEQTIVGSIQKTTIQ